MFGNAKDIKQEWDASQSGILPNVYLKPTGWLNQRRKSELNRFSVLGVSNLLLVFWQDHTWQPKPLNRSTEEKLAWLIKLQKCHCSCQEIRSQGGPEKAVWADALFFQEQRHHLRKDQMPSPNPLSKGPLNLVRDKLQKQSHKACFSMISLLVISHVSYQIKLINYAVIWNNASSSTELSELCELGGSRAWPEPGAASAHSSPFSAQLSGQDAEVQVKGFRSRRAGIGLDLCTHASVATTVHWWLLSPSACSSAPVLCTLQRLHHCFLNSPWVCSSMCTSKAERVFFLARKVFTMAMIRETGMIEHIKCYYSTAVPCNVPFLFH